MINKEMYELGVKPSAIRNLFEYGKKRKALIGEENVFDFSLGNPNVPSPEIVNETLKKLINEISPEQLHGYTSAVGDNNVREKIASYLNETYNVNVLPSLIYMTVGAAAALTISLNAILNKDEEVIVIAPFFPEYKVFIEKANGKVVIVNSDKNTFKPDLEDLKSKINKNTKAIIINYPNNPTGVVLNENDYINLTDVIKGKEKELNKTIYLISDEPYRELVYTDYKTPFVTKYYDNSIICYSFSKSLSLPGERIGYILVSPNCVNCNEVFYAICGAGRSLGYVCAPALFQYMIPYVLGYTSNLEAYKENKEILYNELIKYGYEVIKPEGAFYMFVKAFGNNSIEFCEKAKKYELLLVPSDSFGVSGYVRISYCVSKQTVVNSLPAFKKLASEYKE